MKLVSWLAGTTIRRIGGWIARYVPEMVSTRFVQVGYRVGGKLVTKWIMTETAMPVIVTEEGALATLGTTEAAGVGCLGISGGIIAVVAIIVLLLYIASLLTSTLFVPSLLYRSVEPSKTPSEVAPSIWPNGKARIVPDTERFQRSLRGAQDLNRDFSEQGQNPHLVEDALDGISQSEKNKSAPTGAPQTNKLGRLDAGAISKKPPSLAVPLAPPNPKSSTNYSVEPSGSTLRNVNPSLDEVQLQRERLDAAMALDMPRYNRLIEAHKRLYKEHGVSPCKSVFFPQGCSE